MSYRKTVKVKITNCTTETGGGKIPLRLRHNQNVTTYIGEGFSNEPDCEILNHFFNVWTRLSLNLYFRSTISSKLIRKK